MKGYKAFKPDWTCRDYKYEVGKIHEHKGKIALCEAGFHFCKELRDCLNCYDLDNENHYCEVEAIGNVLEGDNKCVTDKIKILKELSWEDVCDILSEDKNRYVRRAVAYNFNTPVDVLKRLSEDEDCDVRRAVACNFNTPVDVLKRLSEDHVWSVRRTIAGNPNTPIDVLKRLSEDEDCDVRREVTRNLNMPDKLFGKD